MGKVLVPGVTAGGGITAAGLGAAFLVSTRMKRARNRSVQAPKMMRSNDRFSLQKPIVAAGSLYSIEPSSSLYLAPEASSEPTN